MCIQKLQLWCRIFSLPILPNSSPVLLPHQDNIAQKWVPDRRLWFFRFYSRKTKYYVSILDELRLCRNDSGILSNWKNIFLHSYPLFVAYIWQILCRLATRPRYHNMKSVNLAKLMAWLRNYVLGIWYVFSTFSAVFTRL